MFKMTKKWPISFIFLLLPVFLSCEKYLDIKSNQSLTIPTKLSDLQSLMDNYSYLNGWDPASDEISAGDYYLNDADWSAMTEPVRRTYTWQENQLFQDPASEWDVIYRKIYYANTVLEILQKIERNSLNQIDWDNIRGQALFFRAKSFLHIAFNWSLAFDENTAILDLGIPLRLTTDFNVSSTRSSVKQTYDRIIHDLEAAIHLLVLTPKHVMRPSRPAALALLARTYISIRKYDSAFKYSNLCLQLNNNLMDFNINGNGINYSAAFTFEQFNPEVLFHSTAGSATPLNNARAKIDSNLYQSYSDNDLRKVIYFKANNDGTFGFKGGYSATNSLFTGLSINEVVLIRAECYARAGNAFSAVDDLNNLLEKRWKAGTFSPLSAIDSYDALKIVLKERRKELLMRGLRWMDIKRLNKEGAEITLKRTIDGQDFILSPNDFRYALPIPEDVIELTGMQQNYR